MAVVTVTTDFGTADGYAGEVVGVLLERAPSARVVEVTHEVARGDLRHGAWVLGRIWDRYPSGAVHLAVVDPGVGGERRAVAVRYGTRWYVGPDNGLPTLVESGIGDLPGHEPAEVRLLDPERIALEPLSDTFHGRDLFAPAAALLAERGTPSDLGPRAGSTGLVRLPVARPRREEDGGIRGEVVHVDRFGNLVTNVPTGWLPPRPAVEVAGRTVAALAESFAAVEPGRAVLIRGSVGTLEVCVREGRADEALGAARGEAVTVRPAGEG